MAMRKSELERMLQTIPSHRDPDPSLEQYCTPAPMAADILYLALAFGDVEGRHIVDLGCGTGMFAIGAALLGAAPVRGVDIDPCAVSDARMAATGLEVEVDFIVGDVREMGGRADTVFMNPPFGSQRRKADRPFLETAMAIAPVVYSIHNANTMPFLERVTTSLGRKITFQKSYKFRIPHLFKFHEKMNKDIDVMLIRITDRCDSR